MLWGTLGDLQAAGENLGLLRMSATGNDPSMPATGNDRSMVHAFRHAFSSPRNPQHNRGSANP